MGIKGSNGTLIAEGDWVQLTTSLTIKGSSVAIKIGKAIKNIGLTEDEVAIDCRVDKGIMLFNAYYVKKKIKNIW